MKEGQNKIIDVSCALIIGTNDKLLVAQRSISMSLPLKWEFPGGKIEESETAEVCLIREIEEELNIRIEIIKKLDPVTHNYPSMAINLMPFICKWVFGEITLKEHSNYGWLNFHELLDLDWAEADIPVLKNYLNLTNE
jgi:8-oxo-dGTP diphosphatase